MDDALDRALAQLKESLGRSGDVAFTTDELIVRAECAKRNRETVLGSGRARSGAATPDPEG
jgi:hypothetical protein